LISTFVPYTLITTTLAEVGTEREKEFAVAKTLAETEKKAEVD